MNKRKFFLLPICLLLLGACNANQSSPESKEDVKSSEPEVSSVTEDTSTPCEHEFGAWAITRRPTCEGKGEQSRICTKCGEIEKQDVDPLGHSWDEGRVTTPATEEAEGVFTYSCKRSGCTATKTEAIPNLEGYNVTFVTQHCTIKIWF